MTPPRRSLRAAATLLAAAVLAAACGGTRGGVGPSGEPSPIATATAPPSVAPSEAAPSAPPVGSSASAAPTTASPAPAVVLDQAWATAPLVDVATGEAFRIADHAGSVIVIETMAIWCTNCRAQQHDVESALERLPADRVTYVVLDIEPSEAASSLAVYRERNGFTGRYAIAGRDVARALAAEFGDQVLNPPLTPMIVIGTDGRVTFTEFGNKSPDEVVALAESHGA